MSLAGAATPSKVAAHWSPFQLRMATLPPGIVHPNAVPGPARKPPVAPLTFSFFDYPGTQYDGATAISPGVMSTTKMFVAGIFGPGLLEQNSPGLQGYSGQISLKNGVITESFPPPLPVVQTIFGAWGVNDAGEVVGQSVDTSYHGYVYAKKTVTQIDVPFTGATATGLNGINNAGVAVGYYNLSDNTQHGFTWKKGAFSTLPDYPGADATEPNAVNNNGDFAGSVWLSGNAHGFFLHNGNFALFDPPGSVYTLALGMNDNGDIVGSYCLESTVCPYTANGMQGFLYSNGTFYTINYPNAAQNWPTNINKSGTIVGSYVDQAGFGHSYLATP